MRWRDEGLIPVLCKEPDSKSPLEDYSESLKLIRILKEVSEDANWILLL